MRIADLPQPPGILRGWEMTRALLDRMNESTSGLGSRFAVVVLPAEWMIDENAEVAKWLVSSDLIRP